jgi:hypothetical protein
MYQVVSSGFRILHRRFATAQEEHWSAPSIGCGMTQIGMVREFLDHLVCGKQTATGS